MLVALFTCLLLFSSTPAAGRENTISAIQENARAVVTVKAQAFDTSATNVPSLRIPIMEKTGAGVTISTDGIIVTNTHIIYGSQRVYVGLADGTELEARVIFVSPDDDFSFLKVTSSSPLTAVILANASDIMPGNEVITLGHSYFLNRTLSAGRISGIGTRTTVNGVSPELFQLTVNHYEGDSGGPVFNRQGHLLGLMQAKRKNQDKACLAIPVNKIQLAYLSLVNVPGSR